MDNVLDLTKLAGIESFSSRFSRLGDLYLLSHIDTEQSGHKSRKGQNKTHDILPGLNLPFRLDGMLLLKVDVGNITIQVNTEEYTVGQGDFAIIRAGTLLTFKSVEARCAFWLFFISTTFLNSINIDVNAVEFRTFMSHPRTVLILSETQTSVFRRYFELLDANTSHKDSSVFSTRIARSLVAAVVYEILRFARQTIMSESARETQPTSGKVGGERGHNYVYRFMQLLHVHYANEHNLDFYARQLCITSKYLSAVTKNLTGYSAAEWINIVVIREAKNMLRYSDKNVQEVAYALNFPSQSAFGKYFRRLTGQSPSRYR